MAEIIRTSMCDEVDMKDAVLHQIKKKRNSTLVNKEHHQCS